jgi:predicted nucleotidyltransferase component of viral defense system
MNKFLRIPERERKLIFQQTANSTGLPDYVIEKDWWVVQTLDTIFNLECAEYLVFKGGTSLSKGWNLINRFSEDIDLAIDRKLFGKEEIMTNSAIEKLKKDSRFYIINTIKPFIESDFERKGLVGYELQVEESSNNGQDPTVIFVNFENVMNFSSNYINPRVKIEFSCRSLQEPSTKRDIQSYIGQEYPSKEFSDTPISVSIVNVEKTFLEKLFLLHEHFQRNKILREKGKDEIEVKNLSRHLYDIYKICQNEIWRDAIRNKELYNSIVNHRKMFNNITGIDYSLHGYSTLDPIPPMEERHKWRLDYAQMQTEMIQGDSPSFDDLISYIEEMLKSIKSV